MLMNPFGVLRTTARLPKTSWIIQQLTHRSTTRVETGGVDKDSTDEPGEIHSTQQPEDPRERGELVSPSRRRCCFKEF